MTIAYATHPFVVQAAPDKLTLITGDFNSTLPHDLESEDWPTLAPHHQACYLADDLKGVDRSVPPHLVAAGWVGLGHQLNPHKVPTVPTVAYRDIKFATMRCDYLLASKALAQHTQTYQVIRNANTDDASDHYPVLATFEVLQ